MKIYAIILGIILAFPAFSAGVSAEFTVQPLLQDLMLIHGVPAEPSQWPASIYARRRDSACSATIVSDRVVFLASHCVPDGGKIFFSLNANNYEADCAHHPEYDGGNSSADWALCLVARPVTGVLFESLGIRSKIKIGQSVTLSGYGCIHAGGVGGNDGIFRVGQAKVQGLPYRKNYNVVTQGGSALCFGDSGGAGYVGEGNSRVIFGVNSQGDQHAISYLPTVAVPTFIAWANSWAKKSNNVKICGIHLDALYCRNKN